jgi:selenocysteine-specific elongation factor
LVQAAANISARNSSAISRLPIDRVFTMKGFGTVITGTLIAGTIRKEDELDLFPVDRRVRVRGLQVHGAETDRALAGERTAVNLAGVEKDQLARGMTLTALETLKPSSRIDVKLSLLSSARPLKTGSRVHLHAFTSEVIATARLHESKHLPARAEGYAQLQLSEPVLLIPGDRFIIRQFSPVLTIGGGVVLDAAPTKRTFQSRLEFLKTLETADPKSAVLARVARREQEAMSVAQLTIETGHSRRVLEPLITQLVNSGAIVRRGDLLLDRSALHGLTVKLKRFISEFHARNPLVAGISKESLREQARLSPEVFETVLAAGIGNKMLGVTSDVVHLPGRGVIMKDEETESRKMIEQAFTSAGLKVPALKDVVAGLKIDTARAQKIVTLLLREKILVKVSDELVFHRSALDQLRSSLTLQKAKSAKIDVAGFKDLTGVSRKYAIPLLEYLDRERVTKRVGDERIIL